MFTKKEKDDIIFADKLCAEKQRHIKGVLYMKLFLSAPTFWDTYLALVIAVSAAAFVGAVIYIVAMIKNGWDLGEVLHIISGFFKNHLWSWFLLIIPVAGIVVGIVASYWIPVVIVLCGIAAFVLVALIAHLIKKIVIMLYLMKCFMITFTRNERFDDEDNWNK